MLSQRHRQWAIIGPALLERRIVFDGKLRDGLYMAKSLGKCRCEYFGTRLGIAA